MAEHQAEGKQELSEVARRLGSELDELVKLCSFARQALTNEMMSGVGYKKEAITDKDMRKLKELAQTMDIAVSSKVRFEKASKSLADAMTPEQEFASVIQYIRSLEPEQVRTIIVKSEAYLDTRYRLKGDPRRITGGFPHVDDSDEPTE